MKAYLISLGAGLLAGFVYSLLGVRSPAPPVIALVGLAGILLGEQVMPLARRLADRTELVRFVQQDCARHVLGMLPANREEKA
ncbi:MAG TPA: XapX domain-containing protein [Sphingobium sp.]|uniref:XapX domain-containing protein n=1 Tax=Sphingobium sp. TaxID=1912891 RepID=UPI002ED65C0D